MLLFSVSALGIQIKHGPWISDMDSTSVTILWVTDQPGLSWVEIAPDSADHFYGKARPRYYDVLNGRKMLKDSVHRVRIEGLKPNTKYLEKRPEIFDNTPEQFSTITDKVYFILIPLLKLMVYQDEHYR